MLRRPLVTIVRLKKWYGTSSRTVREIRSDVRPVPFTRLFRRTNHFQSHRSLGVPFLHHHHTPLTRGDMGNTVAKWGAVPRSGHCLLFSC
jgi:hypothetical protein